MPCKKYNSYTSGKERYGQYTKYAKKAVKQDGKPEEDGVLYSCGWGNSVDNREHIEEDYTLVVQ